MVVTRSGKRSSPAKHLGHRKKLVGVSSASKTNKRLIKSINGGTRSKIISSHVERKARQNGHHNGTSKSLSIPGKRQNLGPSKKRQRNLECLNAHTPVKKSKKALNLLSFSTQKGSPLSRSKLIPASTFGAPETSEALVRSHANSKRWRASKKHAGNSASKSNRSAILLKNLSSSDKPSLVHYKSVLNSTSTCPAQLSFAGENKKSINPVIDKNPNDAGSKRALPRALDAASISVSLKKLRSGYSSADRKGEKSVSPPEKTQSQARVPESPRRNFPPFPNGATQPANLNEIPLAKFKLRVSDTHNDDSARKESSDSSTSSHHDSQTSYSHLNSGSLSHSRAQLRKIWPSWKYYIPRRKKKPPVFALSKDVCAEMDGRKGSSMLGSRCPNNSFLKLLSLQPQHQNSQSTSSEKLLSSSDTSQRVGAFHSPSAQRRLRFWEMDKLSVYRMIEIAIISLSRATPSESRLNHAYSLRGKVSKSSGDSDLSKSIVVTRPGGGILHSSRLNSAAFTHEISGISSTSGGRSLRTHSQGAADLRGANVSRRSAAQRNSKDLSSISENYSNGVSIQAIGDYIIQYYATGVEDSARFRCYVHRVVRESVDCGRIRQLKRGVFLPCQNTDSVSGDYWKRLFRGSYRACTGNDWYQSCSTPMSSSEFTRNRSAIIIHILNCQLLGVNPVNPQLPWESHSIVKSIIDAYADNGKENQLVVSPRNRVAATSNSDKDFAFNAVLNGKKHALDVGEGFYSGSGKDGKQCKNKKVSFFRKNPKQCESSFKVNNILDLVGAGYYRQRLEASPHAACQKGHPDVNAIDKNVNPQDALNFQLFFKSWNECAAAASRPYRCVDSLPSSDVKIANEKKGKNLVAEQERSTHSPLPNIPNEYRNSAVSSESSSSSSKPAFMGYFSVSKLVRGAPSRVTDTSSSLMAANLGLSSSLGFLRGDSSGMNCATAMEDQKAGDYKTKVHPGVPSSSFSRNTLTCDSSTLPAGNSYYAPKKKRLCNTAVTKLHTSPSIGEFQAPSQFLFEGRRKGHPDKENIGEYNSFYPVIAKAEVDISLSEKLQKSSIDSSQKKSVIGGFRSKISRDSSSKRVVQRYPMLKKKRHTRVTKLSLEGDVSLEGNSSREDDMNSCVVDKAVSGEASRDCGAPCQLSEGVKVFQTDDGDSSRIRKWWKLDCLSNVFKSKPIGKAY